MLDILHAIAQALYFAAAMGWEVLWGLILGFTISAIVDVLVSKSELEGLEIELIQEFEREVVEGKFHTGKGAVVQLVARKPT